MFWAIVMQQKKKKKKKDILSIEKFQAYKQIFKNRLFFNRIFALLEAYNKKQ